MYFLFFLHGASKDVTNDLKTFSFAVLVFNILNIRDRISRLCCFSVYLLSLNFKISLVYFLNARQVE